ncbi:sialidase family protein [Amycolatopsis sp. Hca4]|uniref:sialidase family protein n=1 Tax=Amycolatopsis sp. Hca4 TaxID=2742131 RepID=UPI0015906343|nr:sialidase family protein [Amycolatopsis sp. Hca4]QKV80679.1 exo-alpha-sialidase [Amycolatopsis sp. Hca4]
MGPRQLLSLILPAVTIAALVTPDAAAAPVPSRARAAAEQAHSALQQRMLARSHAHSAVAGETLAGKAAGGGFDRITDVERASRDTVPSINGAEPDTQVEPDIATDPNNPDVIVATFQQGRYTDGGSADPGYTTSQDGGKTWAAGNLPLLTKAVGGPFDRASDAVAAIGGDDAVYLQTIAFNQNDARSAVTVQRSDDGGLSFGPPVLVVDDNDVNIFHDKNWIVVDTSPTSPHRGRVYSVWSKFVTTGTVTHSPGVVSFSDDRGQTWSTPTSLTAADADTEGLLPLVQRDGSLTVVYDLAVNNADFGTAQTSHDGGLTWSAPVTVAELRGVAVPGMRTGGLPDAAIDPATGRIYLVWADTRFNPDGLNDIALSTSRDGGRTWSTPAQVDPRVAGLDRFTPAIAAAGGSVHVTYRTRGAAGTAPTVDQNYIASTDNGRTFGFEHTVGPPSDVAWAAEAHSQIFYGDYAGVAATPRRATFVWNLSSRPPIAGQKFHQTTWTANATR